MKRIILVPVLLALFMQAYCQTDLYANKVSVRGLFKTFTISETPSHNAYIIRNRQNMLFNVAPKDQNGMPYTYAPIVEIGADGTRTEYIRNTPTAKIASYPMLTKVVKEAIPATKIQQLIAAEGTGAGYLHKKGITFNFVISPRTGNVLEVTYEIPKDVDFSSITPIALEKLENLIKNNIKWLVPAEFCSVSHINVRFNYFFSRTYSTTPR